jgi:hypothetical protein
VYYIPKLRVNIVSLRQLDDNGCTIVIKKGVLWVLDVDGHLLTKVQRSTSYLYILELKVEKPVCLSIKAEETSWRWHMRYGHLSFPALQKLSRGEMVHGLLAIDGVGKLCDGCLISK